ncbi:MAG: type II secretion system F family protein [Verrucomicrobiaceae bacterium]|nr:type II secretion system F family protein [Verrucomicrobiaceae bacterium]
MPTFAYNASSASGESKKGSIDAADRGEAVRKLARMGLRATGVKPLGAVSAPVAVKSGKKDPKAKKDAPTSTVPFAGIWAKLKGPGDTGKIQLNHAQIIAFTIELSNLLAAGFQIDQALGAMEKSSDALTRDIALRLRELIRDGIPLSSALAQVSDSFGPLFCSMIAAGESSGALDKILDRQVKYLGMMEDLRSKFVGALIYPAFLAVSGAALGVVMITYLLPKLSVLIKSSSKATPLLMDYMMRLSEFLRNEWWLMLIALGILALGIFAASQFPVVQLWYYKWVQRIPVVGDLMQARHELQFLETLGSLLGSGLAITQALHLLKGTVSNPFIRQQFETIEHMVQEGEHLSTALNRTKALPPRSIDVIRLGEETGNLSEVATKSAGRLDTQFARLVERATALIQPCILVVMAVVVGGIVYAIIDVVFSTLQQINTRK